MREGYYDTAIAYYVELGNGKVELHYRYCNWNDLSLEEKDSLNRNDLSQEEKDSIDE